MRVQQAFGQSGYLYGKDFLASFVQLLPARDEGMRLDGACQLRRFRRTGGDGDVAIGRLRRVPCGPACGEGRVDAAFRAQAFHVDFADDELGVRGEAAGGDEQRAVFVYQAVAAKDYVGGRFAESARREDVSRQAACRLLADERADVGVFSRAFIVGRHVEDDVCAFHCQPRAWRNWRPHVFAYFDSEAARGCVEHETGTYRYVCLSAERHRGVIAKSGCEPSHFVEFLVVWQEGLWHDAQDDSALNHDGTVEQGRLHLKGYTYYIYGLFVSAGLRQPAQ